MIGGRPRDAFEEELLPILPRLRAHANMLTKRADRAEDLYGETVVKMLIHRESYVLGSNVLAWGRFIMKNLRNSEWRRAWRAVEWDDDLGRTIEALSNAHAALELKEVLDAMRHLPAGHAEVVMMLAEGMTYEEAAEETGVEVGTVKSRVARGRAMLEKLFGA